MSLFDWYRVCPLTTTSCLSTWSMCQPAATVTPTACNAQVLYYFVTAVQNYFYIIVPSYIIVQGSWKMEPSCLTMMMMKPRVTYIYRVPVGRLHYCHTRVPLHPWSLGLWMNVCVTYVCCCLRPGTSRPPTPETSEPQVLCSLFRQLGLTLAVPTCRANSSWC